MAEVLYNRFNAYPGYNSATEINVTQNNIIEHITTIIILGEIKMIIIEPYAEDTQVIVQSSGGLDFTLTNI